MTGSGAMSLLWFIAIVAMIPAALWLFKRTPMGGGIAAASGVMRPVSTLPLGANQRLVTIEVGAGDTRRWLVLGVTAQQITTLHTMEPQGELPPTGAQVPPFAQLLNRLRQREDK